MKKGNVILAPFYFTDFTRYKLRLSLIVSCGQSNPDDYIVAFISTILPNHSIHETHFIINSNESFFTNTGLKKTSLLKCDKLMTINQSIDFSTFLQNLLVKDAIQRRLSIIGKAF